MTTTVPPNDVGTTDDVTGDQAVVRMDEKVMRKNHYILPK